MKKRIKSVTYAIECLYRETGCSGLAKASAYKTFKTSWEPTDAAPRAAF